MFRTNFRRITLYKYFNRIITAPHLAKFTSQNPPKFKTVTELIKELSNTMGIEKGYKPIPKNRQHLQKLIPTDQKELPPRSMMDSFTVGLIPLSSDEAIHEKYLSYLGFLRIGKLLEDLDNFAVVVAQKHLLNPKVKPGEHSPYTIVTALVDRIDFTDFTPQPYKDIRICGHVTWAGRSSVEVICWLDQNVGEIWRRITKAVFVLAIRDALNVKSAVVNPLVPKTDEEKKIFEQGEERKRHRQNRQKSDFLIPNTEEQEIMHDLFTRTVKSKDSDFKRRILPAGCVWMESFSISNLIHPHPENRNLHNTVFGGFLMRNALELSNTMSTIFTKESPVLKSISDLRFLKPVTMNSLIRMHAYVVYTRLPYMQIVVYTDIWDALTGDDITTNAFNFTYVVSVPIPEVFPNTYYEIMMFLSGRRHLNDVLQEKSTFTFEPINPLSK